jgi:hypothetical protein
MAQHHTKDERFVICLYENAKSTDDLESSFNRYVIGMQVNLHERGVDAICKLLVQANFIKKDGEDDIYLTPNGISLAERLLDE